MMIDFRFIIEAFEFLVASGLFVWLRPRFPRAATWGFALAQLGAIHLHHHGAFFNSDVLRTGGIYLGLCLLQSALFGVVRPGGGTARETAGARAAAWTAILLPIVAMVGLKAGIKLSTPPSSLAPWLALIGLSYVTFRLSHLALEVRNELVPVPTVAEHLGFALFFPIVPIGPLLRYSEFRASWLAPKWRPLQLATGTARIALGAGKYYFLSNLFSQLGYQALIFDKLGHPPVDLAVAAVSYTLFLYLNFSGVCDIAIGAGELIGIRVPENFDNPFRARNIKDFWNRWHITLSVFMRDFVFNPLSKHLTRNWGPRGANHAIAVSVMTVFLLIGLWHGLEAHYLLFGAAHGLGVAANHYYGVFLRRRLPKATLLRYLGSATVRRICIVVTFAYVCATFMLFALPLAKIGQAFEALR